MFFLASDTMPNVQLDDLYVVLRSWAVAKVAKPQSYSELSRQYKIRTSDWFEPHGSWDRSLGELNQRLHEHAAPALSALVVVNNSQEPGGGFWGSAPNVPPRPKSEVERLAEWSRIVKEVLAFDWPAKLP